MWLSRGTPDSYQKHWPPLTEAGWADPLGLVASLVEFWGPVLEGQRN